MEKTLSPSAQQSLLGILKQRFDKHMHRHPGIQWAQVQQRLEAHPAKLWSLEEMDQTGGEPDVVQVDPATGAITFMDCSPESPSGRRSLCYDRAGLESRKEAQPANTAIDMAAEMGVSLLDEAQYRALQQLGPLDQKTSSWLLTPAPIRKLGGAIFGDYRYGTVFIYHNGAQSYYAARGFRAALTI